MVIKLAAFLRVFFLLDFKKPLCKYNKVMLNSAVKAK